MDGGKWGNGDEGGLGEFFPGWGLVEVVGEGVEIFPELMEDGGGGGGHGRDDPGPIGGDGATGADFGLGELHKFGGGAVVIDDADAGFFEGVEDGDVEFEEGAILPEGLG